MISNQFWWQLQFSYFICIDVPLSKQTLLMNENMFMYYDTKFF